MKSRPTVLWNVILRGLAKFISLVNFIHLYSITLLAVADVG
jgi:hypothetical protein